MRDEYRDLLYLVLFVVGGLSLLSAATLWALNSGNCVGCGDPNFAQECYSTLNAYNSTFENGTAFETPEACYSMDQPPEGLEGSEKNNETLRKTSEGLVVNSTDRDVVLRP